QAASPFDDSSRMVDPQLTNPPGADLTIGAPTSPLVGNGHPTLSAPRDFTGAVRPPAPAIGAFEREADGSGLRFHTLVPCRLLDTRDAAGPYGGPLLGAGASRSFDLTGRCGIPADAAAVSLN